MARKKSPAGPAEEPARRLKLAVAQRVRDRLSRADLACGNPDSPIWTAEWVVKGETQLTCSRAELRLLAAFAHGAMVPLSGLDSVASTPTQRGTEDLLVDDGLLERRAWRLYLTKRGLLFLRGVQKPDDPAYGPEVRFLVQAGLW